MPTIDYLGHAGFVVTHAGKRILIDPWFHPAFLASWFPFPDNRHLKTGLESGSFDYFYISHTHEDHFDRKFLQGLDRNISILCPAYRTKSLQKQFASLGFTRVIPLGHKESLEIAPGFMATMLLDIGHKEDSGILLDMDGFRFLDLNDCNTPLSELPTSIDLLAAQFSGAMWYPNCYDYTTEVMREKVAFIREGLQKSLVSKCRVTEAKAYLPCAGPPCFLDPELEVYNNRAESIFPIWDDVASMFQESSPEIQVHPCEPGDRLDIDKGSVTCLPYSGDRPDCDLNAYRERRREEWQSFHETPEKPVSFDELTAYFTRLQRRNRHLLHDFSKTLRVAADGRVWNVRLGELAEDHEIEGEEPYPPEYTLKVPPRVLRAVIDGKVGWEEALLSMRIRLHRDPDVFDSRFMGLLRYGNEPVQTLQMTKEMTSSESIERDGLRMQRYCPHGSEDLSFATICNGVIECPRHHWKWDIHTGNCLEGGNLKLRVQVQNETANTHQTTNINSQCQAKCSLGEGRNHAE